MKGHTMMGNSNNNISHKINTVKQKTGG